MTFLRKISRTVSKGSLFGKGRARRTDLPLDRQLTFNPTKDERWTFEEERRICLNGVDVAELVCEGGNDVRLLSGVSQGLSEYRTFVWSKQGGKGQAKFNARVMSLQDTIVHRLGNIYDGMTGGVHIECAGENFWINNVNVRAVLMRFRVHPTEQVRLYLMGFRDKLHLILSRQQSSTRSDAIHDQARKIFDEIEDALECLPADAPPRLCAHNG